MAIGVANMVTSVSAAQQHNTYSYPFSPSLIPNLLWSTRQYQITLSTRFVSSQHTQSILTSSEPEYEACFLPTHSLYLLQVSLSTRLVSSQHTQSILTSSEPEYEACFLPTHTVYTSSEPEYEACYLPTHTVYTYFK